MIEYFAPRLHILIGGTDLAGLCSAEARMGRAAGKRVRDQDIARSCTLPLDILDLSHSIDTSFLAFTCFYLVSSVHSLEESECFGSRL